MPDKDTSAPIANQSGPQPIDDVNLIESALNQSLPESHPLRKAMVGGTQPIQNAPLPQRIGPQMGTGQGGIGTIVMHPESSAIEIELPSRGKLYPGGFPKSVTLREMRMHDMMILQTPALWRDNRVFQMIFEHCVQGLPPGMSVLDLLSLDREALLVALRIISFGRKYKVRLTCPRGTCQHKFEHTLDLEADFPVKFLDTDLEYPLIAQRDWMRSKRRVTMRLMTFRDEIEVDRKSDQSKEKGQTLVNMRLMDQLEQVITDVEELDMALLKPWLEGLSAHDASILDQVLSERYFGIETDFTAICPAPTCGNVFGASMPINEDFFRSNLPKTQTPVAIPNR